MNGFSPNEMPMRAMTLPSRSPMNSPTVDQTSGVRTPGRTSAALVLDQT